MEQILKKNGVLYVTNDGAESDDGRVTDAVETYEDGAFQTLLQSETLFACLERVQTDGGGLSRLEAERFLDAAADPGIRETLDAVTLREIDRLVPLVRQHHIRPASVIV